MSPNEAAPVQSESSNTQNWSELLPEQMQALDALQSALSKSTTLATDIEMIIREHLHTAVTTDTFYKIISGLELFLDPDHVFFLLDTLRTGTDPAVFEPIKARCTEPFWGWLRRLIAMYSLDFRKAYSIATENPHAWDKLNRNVYYDTMNNAWKIIIEIVKFNEERLTIEETPAGGFALIYGLVNMLMNVSSEAAPEQVNREYLGNLLQQFHQLIDLYAPELRAEMAQANTDTAVS